MLKFNNVNVNPKGRKTGDCSTRAIVGLLGISYDEALDLQLAAVKKCYYDFTSSKVIDKILSDFGYVKMKQPRKPNNKKYMVSELDSLLSKDILHKGVLITIANHMTVVKDDAVNDIWDCRFKTISNYWIKQC